VGTGGRVRRVDVQVGVVYVDVGREKLDRERQEGWPVDDRCQIGVLGQA
jgi:hypothetical protein